MNKPQPPSPRQRMQALLAIPERQRTDEEWDELNELEIMLASGNREGAPDPNQQRRNPPGGPLGPPRSNKPQGQSQGQGQQLAQGKKPGPGGGGGGRKFHKRPKKPRPGP